MQLVLEQPAQRAETKGAALMLLASGPAWSVILPPLRRAVAACSAVALVLPLSSAQLLVGAVFVSPCTFFFSVKMHLLTSRTVACYFLQLVCVRTAPLNQGIRAVCAI